MKTRKMGFRELLIRTGNIEDEKRCVCVCVCGGLRGCGVILIKESESGPELGINKIGDAGEKSFVNIFTINSHQMRFRASVQVSDC